MTTPFDREILTHFYLRPDGLTPFERITDSYRETVRRFVKLGLLKYDANNDVIAAVNPALEAYMAALAAVPLPTCKWSCGPEWSPALRPKPFQEYSVPAGGMLEQGPCPRCFTRWIASELLPCPTCNRHLYPMHVPVSELRP